MRSGALNGGHVLGAVGIVCLCGTAFLLGTLQRQKQDLGQEVERSVRAGIRGGVDEALAPERVEERSAAAARGLVEGVIDETVRRAGSVRFEEAARGVDAVAGAGLGALNEALRAGRGGEDAPRGAEADGEADAGAGRRPTLTTELGAAGREASDLALRLLDAALAEPEGREERKRGASAEWPFDSDPVAGSEDLASSEESSDAAGEPPVAGSEDLASSEESSDAAGERSSVSPNPAASALTRDALRGGSARGLAEPRRTDSETETDSDSETDSETETETETETDSDSDSETDGRDG